MAGAAAPAASCVGSPNRTFPPCLAPHHHRRSCLYQWQLHKTLQQRGDASSCEVCSSPYAVPPAAQRAYASANAAALAGVARQLRLLRLRQEARAAAAVAKKGCILLLVGVMKLRHWTFWAAQVRLCWGRPRAAQLGVQRPHSARRRVPVKRVPAMPVSLIFLPLPQPGRSSSW